MLLKHERRTILEASSANILAFDEALYDLRRERILTAAHLKAAELKLLVLRQARAQNIDPVSSARESEVMLLSPYQYIVPVWTNSVSLRTS